MDFDDLLTKSLKLLTEHEEIANIYQRQFEFVLVDEYQDTNHIQAEFVDVLAAQHQNIMVVGDDAQSIYSWRGADFRNILQFNRNAIRRLARTRSRPTTAACRRSCTSPTPRSKPTWTSFPRNSRRARDPFGQARAARTQRQQHAGAVRHPAHPGTARRGRRTQRNRGALPGALSRAGIADRTDPPRRAVSDHERSCGSSSRRTSRTWRRS